MGNTPMGEADLYRMIAAKHPPPAWACFSQVRNGTGYSRKQDRTADALAMSLWPSRGIDLHGFEIKIARNDWLRELKNPEKAEELAAYCDRWWMVAPSTEVIRPDELPTRWGLMVPKKKKLVTLVKAEALTAKALDRPLLASILRRAAEMMERALRSYVPREDIRAELDAAEEKGKKLAECAGLDRKYESLKEAVDTFEKASGVALASWPHANKRIGQIVKTVLEGGPLEAQVAGHQKRIGHMVQQTERLLEELRTLTNSCLEGTRNGT